ncbi:MAG: RNA polymerase sigma factor [Deltaproteobacteria bacterium]|nr:RNA polymerase sigma factor [Deltaproteobacteria bacterium]
MPLWSKTVMTGPKSNIALASTHLKHTDAELVRRAIDGDRWAEESLYRAHVDDIYTYCVRMLRHQTDAEDVVQDTFVQAFADLDTLRDPEKFKPWLMRIAYHRMHRVFRRRKYRRMFFLSGRDDTPLDEQATSESTQEQRTELALLDAAIAQMSPEERACWILRYFEKYRIREIVRVTGLSRNTVKRRIAAAKSTVDSHFGERFHE